MKITQRSRKARQRRLFAAIAGCALLGAASAGIVACSTSIAGSATASAPTAPQETGPLLEVSNKDFPFKVQGVSAELDPEIGGEAAPIGKTFLRIRLRVQGVLTDRGLPAPNILSWALQTPDCAPRCLIGLEFLSDFGPSQSDTFPRPPWWTSEVTIPAGQSYDVIAKTLVDEDVDKSRLYLRIPATARFDEKFAGQPRLPIAALLGSTSQVITETPPTLIGTWEGVVTQGASEYAVTVDLRGADVGEAAGSATYPSLSCTSELTLIDGTPRIVHMDEAILTGTCVPTTVTLTLQPDGALQYSFQSSFGSDPGSGSLIRKQ